MLVILSTRMRNISSYNLSFADQQITMMKMIVLRGCERVHHPLLPLAHTPLDTEAKG